MLLPIWLVTYRSQEQSKKVYYYAMNGQTGKVSGVLPISYTRLGLATLGIFRWTLSTLFIRRLFPMKKTTFTYFFPNTSCFWPCPYPFRRLKIQLMMTHNY